MTPSRRAPHCKTCHKPLKGHRRGVCESTAVLSTLAPTPTPPPPSSSVRGRKSAPQPIEMVPTLSPQSSQILHDLLRANSHTFPQVQVPSTKASRRSPRASAGRTQPSESLHEALERLSASEVKKEETFERKYTPTEYDEESPELDGITPPAPTQISASTSSFAVSQQLALKASSGASTFAPRTTRTTSSFVVSQQLRLEESQHSSIQEQHSASAVPSADVSIQNFIDSMSQSSQHPPATIFSFPTSAIPSLEDGAHRLGLFVHVLALPPSKDEWIPVVIGRDAGAIAKLLEDSEKLAQAVRQSGATDVRDFRLGMSHIVVGALGAVATWAGLAYS